MKYDLKHWILSVAVATVPACGDDGGSGESGPAASTGGTTDEGTTAIDPSDTEAADSGSTQGGTEGVDTSGGLCEDEIPSIVTDIDETLTLSDGEFLMQIGDGNYDPVEREGAAELVTAYADLGYRILYLTARSETITLEVTGETAREATERWLDEHGFPNDAETTELVLAPMFVTGEDTRAYKAGALMERQAAGQRFDYAYGNATTDIDAYADAGIALDATFIIGENAGVGGTVAVMGEGWVEHTASHIPTVPAVCEAG